MSIEVTNDAVEAQDVSLSALRRYYVLFVLTLVGTANFLDRQVLTILLEPIRHELSLTDTQIGFCTGIAFTLVNATLAIPVARLADRWSRRKVIALAITFWSAMTMLSGYAQTFTHLFLARFGVGVGEAGGTAPSMALVGDLFGRDRRGVAISILLLSTPLGMALGLLWGGWAAHELGWRRTFFFAGLAGAFIGPLVFFTLPEVRKGMSDGIREVLQQPPFRATVRLLWSIRSLRNMMFAVTLQNFLTMGLTAWIPSFLRRSYEFSSSRIGAGLAIAIGIGLAIGLLAGAPIIYSLGRRDLRWHFWVPTLATFASGCVAALAFVVPPQYVFWLIGLQVLFGALFASLMGAITQTLVPIAVRATATACILFVVNSVAIGLGPQVVGILSDVLRGAFGENSLRIALLCSTSVGIPAALFYFRASLTYRDDIDASDTTYRSEIARTGVHKFVSAA